MPAELNKIKRMTLNQINVGPRRNLLKLKSIDEKKIKKRIEDYMILAQHAFNVQNMAEYVNSELEKSYPPFFIQKFMKNSMNLLYKKVKTRPNNVDLFRL